jgi:hypothetical protein
MTYVVFKEIPGLVTKFIDSMDKTHITAIEMYKDRVVQYTPIGQPETWKYPPKPGYVPGAAKASWDIEMITNGALVYNTVPYATRLEYGWSRQAPQGMARRALMEFPQMLKDAAQRTAKK